MATQMYPKWREALLKDMRAPYIKRMSDGRWLVCQPMPNALDGITAYIILGGPYRWFWLARFRLWCVT